MTVLVIGSASSLLVAVVVRVTVTVFVVGSTGLWSVEEVVTVTVLVIGSGRTEARGMGARTGPSNSKVVAGSAGEKTNVERTGGRSAGMVGRGEVAGRGEVVGRGGREVGERVVVEIDEGGLFVGESLLISSRKACFIRQFVFDAVV